MPDASTALADEMRKYLELHPEVADQLQRAGKAYKLFGRFLSLTQPRLIVRESGGSTTEADLSATVLRSNL